MFPSFLADEMNSRIIRLGESQLYCKRCSTLVYSVTEKIGGANVYICPKCKAVILIDGGYNYGPA